MSEVTQDEITQIRELDRLYMKANETGNQEDWEAYYFAYMEFSRQPRRGKESNERVHRDQNTPVRPTSAVR